MLKYNDIAIIEHKLKYIEDSNLSKRVWKITASTKSVAENV